MKYSLFVVITCSILQSVSIAQTPSAHFNFDSSLAEFYSGSDRLKDVASPESLLARDELEAVVDKAIRELPEDLRTAVTLREFEGLSYEDIAQVMGCPVGTVRSRIFRGREAIDHHIKTLLAGEY